ncbi:DUF6147 family protein [Dorea formicigenerans]|jgi:hypothetical protein|uniref:Fibronectin type III domain-containing protein n=1 Tax=Dorea formicigenerans TaxID=39486 RepID=A0A415UJB8_9FIRM|nr:DUF6147 family protein [Dorea formicigenerans]RHN18153.1 hypothetical protein DWZ24_02715 [Dorea formicigenerans]
MKRCMSICCVFAMALGLSFGVSTDTQAASSVKVIDGSQLTKDAESTGYNQKVARGEDLLTGYSKIVRMGPGEIYAGGTTIAVHNVERIGIGVVIERAKEEDTEWSFYDTWQKFNENADRVSSKKYLDVEGDYYYRVKCVHSAGEDISSSFTDGIYIEEP